MTDKNGKPLKVGDKVTHDRHPECSVIVALHKGSAEARGKWGGFIASCNELTLVEPARVAEVEQAHKVEPNGEVVPLAESRCPFQAGDKVTHKNAPTNYVGVVQGVRSDWKYATVNWPDGRIPTDVRVAYLQLAEPEATLGGIPVVTSEAMPEGEAWLVYTAKIKEFLGTEKGKEILDKVKAPNPVVNLLMGKVESQAFKFPLPEPDYKEMLDEASEKLRNLTRAVTQYLTLVEPAVEHIGTNVFEALERPDGAELFAKAELVSRVRDIVDGFERSRFPEVADEILKAVAAYHG